jgi:hypothetical protein
MNLLYSNPVLACYANDNDALVPELWAQEGLAILEENMVMARLVHRDFSEQVANYGDVVNTRRPGTFTAKRKTDADNVVNQDAVATNVQVPLDQHVYVTFTIKDGEASKSFQDLVEMYLDPAAQEMASSVDRILCGQVHQYLANRVGRLMEMDENNAKDFMLAAREKMNVNKAYPNGRNLVLSPSSETELLKTELFISAEKRGDDGSALRDASLGRVLGFDTFMDQNVPGLTLASTGYASATTDGAEALNATTIAITTTADYVANAGEYVWLEGEGKPHVIESLSDDGNTTNTVVLVSGLEAAVASSADVYIYKAGYVDNGAGYAAGYAKAIKVDNGSGALMAVEPQVGQLVSFGTGASRHTYTIIAAEQSDAGTETEIWLDRPLEAALSNDDLVFPGPSGSFNFAFHKNALALVSRPLALPNNALGVRSSVGSYNDVTMRVSMQYDISSQGTIVTLDLLCGVALLDANLGCVLLG